MRTIVAILCALLMLLSSACTNSADNNDEGLVLVGAHAAPPTLDPSANDAAAIPQALLYNVYETLLKIDSDGQIRNLLAESYEISDDGLVYRFTLNPDAKFASGKAVDAEAVVKSMQRIRESDAVSQTLKKQYEVVESEEVIDEHNVEFHLNRPSNAWLYNMTQTLGIIYDPDAIDDGNLATKPAGSGPYIFSEWRQEESLSMVTNSNYWGQKPSVKGVKFKYYTDPNAMNNAMLSGQLDIISNVTAPQALSQFDDSKYTVSEGTTNGEIVLGFNNSREPFTDVRVRQAINYAIDKKAIQQAVWEGKGEQIQTMVPPTDPWYEDLEAAYPYDLEKAKQLLFDAGYADGLTLNLRVPSVPYATGAATYIASQLSQVGITVNVEQLEFPARWIDEVMINGNYDMTIVSHVEGRDIVRFADPDYYWHYDNKQFQQLIADADTAQPEEQISLMKQAARILRDDAAADFLWLLPNLIVTKSNITNIPVNATSLSFDLTGVKVA